LSVAPMITNKKPAVITTSVTKADGSG
jgi:hypothetical protein